MDSQTKTFEQAATLALTGVTVLQKPSTGSLPMELPARLDDRALVAAEAMANAPLPALPPCDNLHFAKCMRTLQAALPKRNSDDLSGELFVAAYRRMLGHHPGEAIDFLCIEVLARCKWFPTIAECSEIIVGWKRADPRGAAINAVRQERQARFDEIMASLRNRQLDQVGIDALPDQIKAVGETHSYLWRWPDGRYTVRADTARMSEEQLAAHQAGVAAMRSEWALIRLEMQSHDFDNLRSAQP